MAKAKCGIYQILCAASGEIYVGSSVQIYVRWHQHRYFLRRGTSNCLKLQRAWKKHGEQAFRFSVLEECSPGVLEQREQHYINELKPALNIVTDLTYGLRQILAVAIRKNWQNPEYVKKVTEALLRGTKNRWLDPEFREKHSARLGQMAKDAWQNPEIRARQIAIRQELAKDPEFRERLAELANAQWRDPEFRTLMSDPEFVARRSAATAASNRERVWTPDATAKRVEKFKKFWDEKRGGPRPPKPGHAKGERVGTAKLTEEIVREIRALEGKMKRPEIAAKFGLNVWHVRDIQKRRCWTHVEDKIE